MWKIRLNPNILYTMLHVDVCVSFLPIIVGLSILSDYATVIMKLHAKLS